MATQLDTPEQPAQLPVRSPEREAFSLMQREAALFAASPLIPQHLRSGGADQAMANCYIALKLAKTMGEDPLVVLQNIHIVNGKAGFAAQYMIARANASGIFEGRIDWRIDRGQNLAVTAFAILKDTGQEVSVTVDMAMAAAEGWTNNKKYKSMPEIMLRYRSAAFLIRFYAPDVMLGYHTAEEVEDVAIASGPSLSAAPLTITAIEHQAAGTEPEPTESEPTGVALDEAVFPNTVTLETAKAEIDGCELVHDVNGRVAALLPLLGEEDADALRGHAMDRIAALNGS